MRVVASCGPDWVGLGEGVKVRFEECQGVKGSSILSQFGLPEINHFRLCSPFKGRF